MPKTKVIPDYLPPVLIDKKNECYIEYYVKGIRQRIRMNRYRKTYCKSEFLKIVDCMINDINDRYKDDAVDEREKITMLAERWILEKSKELRPDTMRSYKSYSAMFLSWCSSKRYVYIDEITVKTAAQYMDYIFNIRDVSITTRNNQLKLARAFFGWVIENGYLEKNPFSLIKKKREKDKRRILIPPDARQRIISYLQEEPAFLCVCQLVYTSLIRPKEITMIKIRDVDLKRHVIEIPNTNSKNHHTRYATLSADIESYLASVIKHNTPSDYYLFSRDNLLPGAVPVGAARFRKRWIRLREDLNLPAEMQLYSFRDTGIVELLESSVDPLAVMHHADHHDLSITTRYANHADPGLTEKIYNKIKF